MRYNEIGPLLSCPKCHSEHKSTSLETDGKGLRCRSCQNTYPTTGGLLWLFASPNAAFHDWKTKYNFFLQTLAQEVEEIKASLRETSLLKETQDRLQRLVQGKQEHLKEVKKVLEPLAVSEEGPIERGMALKVKLPETQQLMSYYHNVLRDWGWGEEENRSSLAIIQKALKGDENLGAVAVLGAGAGRLAVDCHNHFSVTKTLAVDINPFLSLCLKRMVDGRALTFYEFPFAPVNKESFAARVRCEAKEGCKENFFVLLADAMNPPLADQAVNTVITPWLIDIVPQDSRTFFKRLNRILPVNGRWINFGSLAYHQKSPHLCYSREEILRLAAEAGFLIESVQEDEVPYLQSPHSCQKRFEKIFCFVAKKVADVPQAETFYYLPAWIRDTDAAIPVVKELTQMVIINRTFADLVALVDGKRSIADISTAFAAHTRMHPDEALELVRQLFINLFESQLRRAI